MGGFLSNLTGVVENTALDWLHPWDPTSGGRGPGAGPRFGTPKSTAPSNSGANFGYAAGNVMGGARDKNSGANFGNIAGTAMAGSPPPVGTTPPSDLNTSFAPKVPDTGTQSGPGILESWFNQRAQGIDAASEYAKKRGLDALNDRFAAAGMANSGAARQQDSDLLANIEAQRASQLDALAAGASGEHQRRIEDMFNEGQGIASGRSAINSAYDLAAAKAQADALAAALGFGVNKAGVDSKAQQSFLDSLFRLGALAAA